MSDITDAEERTGYIVGRLIEMLSDAAARGKGMWVPADQVRALHATWKAEAGWLDGKDAAD